MQFHYQHQQGKIQLFKDPNKQTGNIVYDGCFCSRNSKIPEFTRIKNWWNYLIRISEISLFNF